MLKYNVIRAQGAGFVHFYTREAGLWTTDPSRARQFPVYELAIRMADRLGGGAMVVLATRPLTLDALRDVVGRAISVIEESEDGREAHASLLAELRDVRGLCDDCAMTDGRLLLEGA